jgi:SAM-dependent methyltransferase
LNDPDHTIKTWNEVALLYQEKFMNDELYNDTYDRFCELIPKTDPDILEIGCGPGNITRYLLRKRPDLKLSGTDAAPNMVELAGKNNPSANFSVLDCRDISSIHSRFCGIICGFCMPYLSRIESEKLIRDCSHLLNKDGIFYFSVIEGDPASSQLETSSNGQHTLFVHYHQEAYLAKALLGNGFETPEFSRKYRTKNDGTRQTDLIFIARKK